MKYNTYLNDVLFHFSGVYDIQPLISFSKMGTFTGRVDTLCQQCSKLALGKLFF